LPSSGPAGQRLPGVILQQQQLVTQGTALLWLHGQLGGQQAGQPQAQRLQLAVDLLGRAGGELAGRHAPELGLAPVGQRASGVSCLTAMTAMMLGGNMCLSGRVCRSKVAAVWWQEVIA
jgi:hypothetical protein